ncbi:KNTase domain-containing protein [Paenibacillus sp. ACRRX]|uniref:kanamycin nucleotidyltransferase C-terminal domain-containing protein n=1 Tax=Paenibacillus sp. ACRRX TaxID=2918206 RepID=UPI001EF4BA72|nr:kanamycin nucleotidyltransferase C-terminal domain-containing protein [Paenibacillus sp. ACRRX]MCG7409653.1 KNTase domain-containing protein [Paenibacillus sp. ACRRX]
MVVYPVCTTREEKLAMIEVLKNRLLAKHKHAIMAIGVYGSIGQGTDGHYSDIEMHVITQNSIRLDSYEFIYDKFKIEISTATLDEAYIKAKQVDDMWPIKAGVFIHVLSLYDPHHIFEELKLLPLQVPEVELREVMKQFMIWESYETMGKIRNNWENGNVGYLAIGAKDLSWQTAKLIGLANKQYFRTRAKTFQDSLAMKDKPAGYEELVMCVLEGNEADKEKVYVLCERLWSGLNEWFERLGIKYKSDELPF